MREITSVFEVFELKISGLTKVAFLKTFKMHIFLYEKKIIRGASFHSRRIYSVEKDKKN